VPKADPLVAAILADVMDVSQSPWQYLSCPGCGSSHISRWLSPKFVCFACNIRFNATLAELPVRKPIAIWLLAAILVWRGASCRQLEVLGVSHKSAVRMACWIRERAELPTPQKRQLPSQQLYRLLTRVHSEGIVFFDWERMYEVLRFTFWDFTP